MDDTAREIQAWSLAKQWEACQQEEEALEARKKSLKRSLENLYPELAEGASPPGFSVSTAERVEITDPAKALAYLLKNKTMQAFFKLSITKDTYQKMKAPSWATLKTSAPSIKLNKKKLAELDERFGSTAFISEADNPTNDLAA